MQSKAYLWIWQTWVPDLAIGQNANLGGLDGWCESEETKRNFHNQQCLCSLSLWLLLLWKMGAHQQHACRHNDMQCRFKKPFLEGYTEMVLFWSAIQSLKRSPHVYWQEIHHNYGLKQKLFLQNARRKGSITVVTRSPIIHFEQSEFSKVTAKTGWRAGPASEL